MFIMSFIKASLPADGALHKGDYTKSYYNRGWVYVIYVSIKRKDSVRMYIPSPMRTKGNIIFPV
jgi:hypothetical protein